MRISIRIAKKKTSSNLGMCPSSGIPFPVSLLILKIRSMSLKKPCLFSCNIEIPFTYSTDNRCPLLGRLTGRVYLLRHTTALGQAPAVRTRNVLRLTPALPLGDAPSMEVVPAVKDLLIVGTILHVLQADGAHVPRVVDFNYDGLRGFVRRLSSNRRFSGTRVLPGPEE